jgi:hypothetical protein
MGQAMTRVRDVERILDGVDGETFASLAPRNA